jgi:hypothetical protein
VERSVSYFERDLDRHEREGKRKGRHLGIGIPPEKILLISEFEELHPKFVTVLVFCMDQPSRGWALEVCRNTLEQPVVVTQQEARFARLRHKREVHVDAYVSPCVAAEPDYPPSAYFEDTFGARVEVTANHHEELSAEPVKPALRLGPPLHRLTLEFSELFAGERPAIRLSMVFSAERNHPFGVMVLPLFPGRIKVMICEIRVRAALYGASKPDLTPKLATNTDRRCPIQFLLLS